MKDIEKAVFLGSVWDQVVAGKGFGVGVAEAIGLGGGDNSDYRYSRHGGDLRQRDLETDVRQIRVRVFARKSGPGTMPVRLIRFAGRILHLPAFSEAHRRRARFLRAWPAQPDRRLVLLPGCVRREDCVDGARAPARSRGRRGSCPVEVLAQVTPAIPNPHRRAGGQSGSTRPSGTKSHHFAS
jgi:hypothetical protein